MADEAARGRFFWHEMMSPDPKAGTAFYEKLIGWSPQPWDKDPTYTFFSMGGRPMAGLMKLPDEAKARLDEVISQLQDPLLRTGPFAQIEGRRLVSEWLEVHGQSQGFSRLLAEQQTPVALRSELASA